MSLFLYRLKVNPRTLRILFRISAVQALVCKAASIAGTVYVWAKVRRMQLVQQLSSLSLTQGGSSPHSGSALARAANSTPSTSSSSWRR